VIAPQSLEIIAPLISHAKTDADAVEIEINTQPDYRRPSMEKFLLSASYLDRYQFIDAGILFCSERAFRILEPHLNLDFFCVQEHRMP
jgi:hypothetical protein